MASIKTRIITIKYRTQTAEFEIVRNLKKWDYKMFRDLRKSIKNTFDIDFKFQIYDPSDEMYIDDVDDLRGCYIGFETDFDFLLSVEIKAPGIPKKDESRFGNNFIALRIRMTVAAYCRESALGVDRIFQIHTELIPVDVLDIILLYLAKPMRLSVTFEEKEESLSVCPVLDSWNEINRRLANVFGKGVFNVDPNESILLCIDAQTQDFVNISPQNWKVFQWNEGTDVMTWIPKKI